MNEHSPAPAAETQGAADHVEVEQPLQPQITLSDMRTVEDIRTLFANSSDAQMQWASKRAQETGYAQAVQTEFALNRTDLHMFIIHAILQQLDVVNGKLLEAQQRIADLSLAVIGLQGKKKAGK